MTENEAIKELETSINLAKMCTQNYERKREIQGYEMAIKALEDMQQYRALGTVEKLTANMEELKRWHTDKIAPNVKNPFAYTSTLCCCNCDHKDEYIEELEAEVEEYQQIGTPEECRAAVEKQTETLTVDKAKTIAAKAICIGCGYLADCKCDYKGGKVIDAILSKHNFPIINEINVSDIPTAYDPDKVVEQLKERTAFLKGCTKYGNKTAKQQAKSYDTMMMYEIKDLVDDLIEIVKGGGVNGN